MKARDGAFAGMLPPLATSLLYTSTPAVWGHYELVRRALSFVTRLFFQLLSFVAGTVCLLSESGL